MKPKKLDKQILENIPLKDYSKLSFEASPKRKTGVYVDKIRQCIQDPSLGIRILYADNYMLQQLKQAAKALKASLVFARSEDFIIIKVVTLSEDFKKLILFLREPRTMAQLEGQKYQLDLSYELDNLMQDDFVQLKGHQGVKMYSLTPKGERRFI